MQTITFELTYLNYQGDSDLHISPITKIEENPVTFNYVCYCTLTLLISKFIVVCFNFLLTLGLFLPLRI